MSGIGIASQASSQRARRPLLSSCALAAAMVALGHSPALAQSFNGTGTVVSGSADINNSMPGQTTINVGGSAIINWTPGDTAAGNAPIIFQDAGTTATFNGPGGYTVLNRILPGGSAAGRPVQLNGTIQSNAISGQGGAIWFYTPNGLIIGSTASINVGSLLLTTRSITNSDFETGNGTGVYNFGSLDNSRAAITIQPGAMIDAQSSFGGGSYVAMVAPRIKQGGSVRVDGSAAYVAAEQATITINNGLFGIEVQSGSAVDTGIPDDDVTLEHTGSTGGAASTGDPRAIYMVAIPKNAAITMLVGGNVGYDATSASIQNGRVILSAGYNIDNTGALTNGPASGIGSNATITGGAFSSDTSVSARTDATAQGNLTVDGILLVTGGHKAQLKAAAGESITIAKDLGIQALNTDNTGAFIRGTAAIDLGTNAQLTALGQTYVDAVTLEDGNAQGGFASVTAGSGANFETSSLVIRADARSNTGSAQGGDAVLSMTGATLDAGFITVSADGDGSNAQNGLSGTGGTATLSLTNASVTAGSLRVSAEGRGSTGQNGFSGTGGSASVTADNATLGITDGLFITAAGYGGAAFSGGIGGTGTGGTASFTGTATNVTTQGPISIVAEGYGGGDGTSGNGNGVNGGDGHGGIASYSQSGGTVSAGDLLVEASGLGSGGSGSQVVDFRAGNGGAGIGGTATILVSSGDLDVNYLAIEAQGQGSLGGESMEILNEFGYGTGTGTIAGNGGSATGGTANLTVGGSIFASELYFDARGQAGSASDFAFGTIGNGGNAKGGIANFSLTGGTLGIASPLTIQAGGSGGFGLMGGSGEGGRVTMLVAPGSTFTHGDNPIRLSATGSGGGSPSNTPNGVGGAGIGGRVELTISGDLNITTDLDIDASASGGSSAGTGGAATGGNVTVTVNGGGALDVAGSLLINAGANNRENPNRGDGVNGGTANGGSIAIALADNASLSASGLEADVAAFGGDGAYSGAGGAATGGTIAIDIAANSAGSVLNVDSGLDMQAGGRGGATRTVNFSGTGNGGHGGAGTGGSITVRTVSGSLNVGESLVASASGSGGRTADFNANVTGNAGAGTGGNILFDTGAAAWTAGNLSVDASGNGGYAAEMGYGNGGDGGAGTGGTARLVIGTGSLNATSLFVDAAGFGGDGGTGETDAALGAIAGGKGGDAAGGLASVTINGGTLTLDSLDAYANANGGSGGNSFSDGPAGAGGNALAGGHGGTAGGATINITGGGRLNSTDIRVSAVSSGGFGGFVGFSSTNSLPGANGGDATGGRASISVTNGTIATSATSIDAGAFGGNAAGSSFGGTTPARAGSATGGTAELILNTADATFDLLTVAASASGGGNSFVQTGNAQGGTARISTSGGSLAITEFLQLTGGASSQAGSGTAPKIIGGTAAFEASNGTSIDFGPGSLTIDASATMSPGEIMPEFALQAVTPLPAGPGTVIGGNATLSLNGVSLNLTGDLQLNANAEGLAAGTSAQGGSATLAVSTGGALTVAGLTTLNANGVAAEGDIGGIGQGGTITLRADGGTINANQITLDANGTGGASFSGPGGAGAGGAIIVDVRSAASQTGSITATDLTATAIGSGGASLGSNAVNGGNATGGAITIAGNGTTTLTGPLILAAYGLGGESFNGGSIGTTSGGNIQFDGGSANTAGLVDIRAGHDIQMLAGSAIRSNTGIVLNAGNDILIGGTVALANAASDSAVRLTAANNLRVDIASGSVTLANQAGALGGRLEMDARTVFVGTQQAWTDVSTLSTIDAIDRRLGNNDGINNPQGFLRANTMVFRVRNGLYIQNSGANVRPSGQRAGFTVGTGGATIVNLNSAGSPIQIAVNGHQLLSDGTFATGKDLIPLLTISGASSANPNATAGYDPRSTVNGCLIMGDSCRSDTPPSIGLPQQDVIAAISDGEEDFDGETGLVQSLTAPVIQFAELGGITTEPVIEQPVTGAGNEGLWLDAGNQDAVDIREQVTGTRKDDTDQNDQGNAPLNQQVTGTRNENLDEPVTGTRNENLDQPVEPKP